MRYIPIIDAGLAVRDDYPIFVDADKSMFV